MDELEYKTLRYNVMKKYMALLDFTDKEHVIFLSGDWDEAMILKHREEANYEQLKNDFWQSVEDWRKLLENTEITSENLPFIKFSKSFLSQFDYEHKEMQDFMIKELHKLLKLKKHAVLSQRYEAAADIRRKIVNLASTL